jgi:hypothetical protein
VRDKALSGCPFGSREKHEACHRRWPDPLCHRLARGFESGLFGVLVLTPVYGKAVAVLAEMPFW